MDERPWICPYCFDDIDEDVPVCPHCDSKLKGRMGKWKGERLSEDEWIERKDAEDKAWIDDRAERSAPGTPKAKGIDFDNLFSGFDSLVDAQESGSSPKARGSKRKSRKK